ncbi:MAG: TetR/AcrR family transcriptional regulator [Nannocystaceae bacterium]
MARRVRRSATDTRTAILDVAEAMLVRVGPAGLRLQDVAETVGVSHPAVLHHFESREGLIRAVVERASVRLQHDLLQALSRGVAPGSTDLLDRVHETLTDKGHGRLLAWLMLSGYEPLASDTLRQGWAAIVDATHAKRPPAARGSREDTAFAVLLSAFASLAVSIAGKGTFEVAGFGRDREIEKRFRAWLSRMLAEHLSRKP